MENGNKTKIRLNKIWQKANKKLSGQIDISYLENCDRIEVSLPNKENNIRFGKIIPFIYSLLDQEQYVEICLINYPYCTVNDNSRDHIALKSKKGSVKVKKCKTCKYYRLCVGFPKYYIEKFGTKEISTVKDIPKEIMIEVEPGCNFDCSFCYNKNSFAKNGRDINGLSTNKIKKIIDNIAKSGVEIIRFTGGEPLLRPDIFELFKYSKDKGLKVGLNTNCFLVNEKDINKFKGLIDDVLNPVESFKECEEFKLTGQKNSLKRKIAAIKLFRKINVPKIRVGTVASKENIKNFKLLAKFILSLPIDEWELYRPVATTQNKSPINNRDVAALVNQIINIRKTTRKKVIIGNAIPFCALKDKKKLNYISNGGMYEDGHSRMVVDPRGFFKPHYFIDIKLGPLSDIISAWQTPIMIKLRNLEYLPPECYNCGYKFKCRGGSRFDLSKSANFSNALDPLAKYYN